MECIAITVQGAIDTNIFKEVTKLASKSDCHIVRAQGQVLGSETSLSCLIEGNWNHIAKVENSLETLAKKMSLSLHVKRCDPPTDAKHLLPYLAQVVALDQPDMLYNLCDFFSGKGIQIESLQSDSYKTGPNNTPMLTMNISVNIDASLSIADAREQFMLFCDELNVDGILEPERR